MKTRDEVISLLRAKYDYLKLVYPKVGPFEKAVSSNFYQNPDGGWQMNLENWAAITLRPGDGEPHEIHGPICRYWYSYGGAFKDGMPGYWGYPVSDQKDSIIAPVPPDQVLTNELAFELHMPIWEGEEYALHHPKEPRHCSSCKFEWASVQWAEVLQSDDFQRPRELTVTLNEQGKRHVPKDIENAIEVLLRIQGVHVEGDRSWSCDLHHSLPVGFEWKFHAEVKEYEEFSIVIERAGTDIHATINARGKSSFLGGAMAIEKQFTIPNRFRAI